MHTELPTGTPADVASVEDPSRGLVIAPDVMGLRELFDQMASRLAGENRWAVEVVEPFPGRTSMLLDDRLEGRIDVDRTTADLVAAADDLTARFGVERVAVIGFCMGGMNACRAAGTGRFDRAVSFYGMIRPPEQWSELHNDPLDALARDSTCPTLALLGGSDRWTPPEDVDALRALPNVEVVVYEEADHGFVHDPSRPAHRPADAADAWARARQFLA